MYKLTHKIIFVLAVLLFSLQPILFANQGAMCVLCHVGKGAGKVDVKQFKKSVHGKLGCVDCHKEISMDHANENSVSVQKVRCGECHSGIKKSIKNSIHNRLVGQDGKADLPGCKTCHGVHYISSVLKGENQDKDYCLQCHDNILLTTAYHTKKFIADKLCLQCHVGYKDYAKELHNSVHRRLSCVDCHSYVVNNFVGHQKKSSNGSIADCSLCHKDATLKHRDSIHGISLRAGTNEAAHCWDCHGAHDTLRVKHRESRVFPDKLVKTCGVCHDNSELVAKYLISAKSPGKTYSQSVHGKLVESGRMDAANCVLCHGVHDIKNIMQPGSTISSFNVPETCGKCHDEILKEYKQSIHWIYAKKGVSEAPVCNDCHSEHAIIAINTVNKNKKIQKIQEETCIHCHQNPLLTRKFGLSGEQPHQYKDSYHGLATSRGDVDSASCVSCHGTHKILPKNHPESMVNSENVTQTCKKCHANVTKVFSQSYSHQTSLLSAQKVEYWVREIYLFLIVVVVGGMVVHNLLIFVFEIRKRFLRTKKRQTILRFSGNEVTQHLLLMISFSLLAFTGFALKLPNHWLFEWMSWVGVTETIRQYIHRTSGIVFMALGVYHVFYLGVTRRGRGLLLNLLPGFSDLRELINNVLYYLYIKKSKPEFGQFNYVEKMEYWAVVWGTLVMAFTGFVLWFPAEVSLWVPMVWFIKVNEIVHFYEAILAITAIFVWHLFFVVFHPGEYPMSFSWLNGKVPVEHYKEHHKRHFIDLKVENEEGKSDR